MTEEIEEIESNQDIIEDIESNQDLTEKVYEFQIGDMIDYIDCTRNLYLEAAYQWASQNNADVVELVDLREEKEDGLLHRQFQIVSKVRPHIEVVPEESHEDTPEERIDKEKIKLREQLIDRQTIRRIRKLANHTWTAEDEEKYLLLDAQVTGIIEDLYGDKNDESGDESL